MATSPALFIKTSKQLNHIGIVLLWLTVGLMAVVFLAESPVLRIAAFAGFAFMYLFWMAASRRGAIFDFVVVQPNHFPRLMIASISMLAVFAGLVHLAMYSNPVAFIGIAVVVATAATLLRFIGVQE